MTCRMVIQLSRLYSYLRSLDFSPQTLAGDTNPMVAEVVLQLCQVTESRLRIWG